MSRLEEIKDRCKVMTLGDWVVENASKSNGMHVGVSSEYGMDIYLTPNKLQNHANANFVAHARSDIPYTLAEIERLQGAILELLPDWRVQDNMPAAVRALSMGCGYVEYDGPYGRDHDCEHAWPWTCEQCSHNQQRIEETRND